MTVTSPAERVLFLPGASGVASFWQPVIDRLDLRVEHVAFDYPGFGPNPPDPRRSSLDDLARWIETYVDRPVDILAQSMGGGIAMDLVMRHPELVRHLVLTGTSGGVSMEKFDLDEVHEAYRRESAGNPAWFSDRRNSLARRVANLPMPALLVFGAQDGVAPLSIGKYLAGIIPDARLVTIDTASHFFVRDLPDQVAPHIQTFLDS